MKAYIGVDPGISGAVGIIMDGGRRGLVQEIPAEQTKGTKKKINIVQFAYWFENFKQEMEKECFIASAYMEHVNARPMQGVVSMFNFGHAFGVCHGILAANDITVHLITSAKWQKTVRATEDPRFRCCELMPWSAPHLKLKKDKDKADALLIAYAGMLIEENRECP